jgi:hypothetical protein
MPGSQVSTVGCFTGLRQVTAKAVVPALRKRAVFQRTGATSRIARLGVLQKRIAKTFMNGDRFSQQPSGALHGQGAARSTGESRLNYFPSDRSDDGADDSDNKFINPIFISLHKTLVFRSDMKDERSKP